MTLTIAIGLAKRLLSNHHWLRGLRWMAEMRVNLGFLTEASLP